MLGAEQTLLPVQGLTPAPSGCGAENWVASRTLEGTTETVVVYAGGAGVVLSPTQEEDGAGRPEDAWCFVTDLASVKSFPASSWL